MPASRALPGWWRGIPIPSPTRVWLAHLVLHRVEALVEIATTPPLRRLADHLLTRLRTHQPLSASALAASLHLDTNFTLSLLDDLLARGHVERTDHLEYRLSDLGAASTPPEYHRQRRVFYFVDHRPPFYLALTPDSAWAYTAPSGWRFDLTTLRSTLAQSPEWKNLHHFPSDIQRVVWPVPPGEADHWRAVPLDRAEQTLLLLIETSAQRLLGLRINPDNWALGAEVVLDLPAGSKLHTLLQAETRSDDWRPAWQALCQQRGFSPAEVDGCRLEPAAGRLRVHAPQRLVDRLRQSRSDILRGETWLFPGTGRIRQAAIVDVVT